MNNNKQHSIQSVQCLRGIAAFMVLLHHLSGTKDLPITSSFGYLCSFGWMGVNIFFIISGFIIPYSMFAKDYRMSDFKIFFVRRLTRIEPPYIVSIGLVLLLNYSNTISPWYNGPAFTVDWANVIGHFGYINAFTGLPWLNLAYWTLAIEFEYYLLIALLYPLITNSDKRVLLVTYLVLLAAAFIPAPGKHILIFLPFFLMGIALFLFKAGKINASYFFPMVALAAAVVFYTHGNILLCLSVFSLLFIYYVRKVGTALLLLGTISYSLYLTHGVLVTRFMALSLRYMSMLAPWMRVCFCIIFCLLFAYVYYLLIERPSLALAKKIKFTHKGAKKEEIDQVTA
jgi:peptidoglycan/LPS O-acetylase OafA/YrhL